MQQSEIPEPSSAGDERNRHELWVYWKGLDKEQRELFCRIVGIDLSYMPQLLGGHRKPSWLVCLRMHYISQKQIPLRSLRSDLFADRPMIL